LCKSTIDRVQSPWLKATEAREYLRISNNEFRRLIKNGEIRSVVRGNTTFVQVTWLDEYMLRQPSGAATIATALKP
jgi:excisionase family DNA binding protein